MELILFFSVLLFVPIIGGLYSIIGEGKKRDLRLGLQDKPGGIGNWYVHSLTSWRQLFLYYWFLFEIPYVFTYLITLTFLPSYSLLIINIAQFGVFLSTIGAIVISIGLQKVADLSKSMHEAHE